MSGHERDHLFLNLGGDRFLDVAGASGLDHPGDGRAMAILDYDRDGFADAAVASANAPLLSLYRNRIGDRGARGQFVALRFIGGNRAAAPSDEWSSRDGYGAQVTVDTGERNLLREHRAGEGFAAQNSPTMLVGIGSADAARSITVRWPSGRSQTVEDVPARTLLTLYENPADSPSGEGFERQTYEPAKRPPQPSLSTSSTDDGGWPTLEGSNRQAELTMYTTMATWCQACVDEVPQLNRLRSVFEPEVLAMVGVPYDEKETPEKRRAWVSTYSPPYDTLFELPGEDVQAVKRFVESTFKLDGIPASVITGPDGRILLSKWGPPTVSEIRQLLAPREAGR